MYKTTRLTAIALWSALLCSGCDTASEKSPRTVFDRSVYRGSDIRVYYPQLNEPVKSDHHRSEEVVNSIGPFEYLKKSEVFRLGPVGFAAETPPEDIALRMLMANDDRSALLEKLFAEASIAGKLYALTGFYYSDRSTFNELASGLREDSRSVPRQSGCIGFTQTVKEIIQSIESGNFDKDMQRGTKSGQ
jgi:hypothetical protein